MRSRLFMSQKLKQEWCIVVWMAFWDFAKVSFKFQGVALNAVWSSKNLEIRCLNDAWKKGLSFTKWWKERVSNCLSSFGLDGVRHLNRASHCSKSQLFCPKKWILPKTNKSNYLNFCAKLVLIFNFESWNMWKIWTFMLKILDFDPSKNPQKNIFSYFRRKNSNFWDFFPVKKC